MGHPAYTLQDVSAGDIVLVAPTPGYPDTEPVEPLPEIWTTVCHVVHTASVSLHRVEWWGPQTRCTE